MKERTEGMALTRAACRRVLSLVAVACGLALFAGTGCDSDAGGDSNGDVVGTWALYSGNFIARRPAWYIHFKPDDTYTFSDHADGSAERAHGTYTTSGNVVSGPFINPGVGVGRIDAVVTDDVLSLNLVEYGQKPHTVVPYVGRKI